MNKPKDWPLWKLALLWGAVGIGLFALSRPAHADNPILSTICKNVDCLNNFTAKTGYSWTLRQVMAGGYTDLEQSWYVSPDAGFEVPIAAGPATGKPLLDVGVLLKVGKLLSDKVSYIHTLVNTDPFVAGAFKYATIGESGGWDYTGSPNRFYDLSWAGFSIPF
jgi:hypothetical protein